jgi:hypothetical protein
MLVACGSYRQNIMFSSADGHVQDKIKPEIIAAENNYKIRKNDQLTLMLYSNEGEKLIEPGIKRTQPGNTTYIGNRTHLCG